MDEREAARMTPPISVALVDDHRVVTHGLRVFLESFPDLRVAGVASSGEELLRRVGEWRPRIVILDLLMPGGIDGIETARRLREVAPEVRVVALTASTDEARMAGILRVGACGYVRKDADPEVLLDAVRAVARGKTFIDPAVAAETAAAGPGGRPSGPLSVLSPREREVLRELAFGRTNREIGERLAIGEETVKTHVARILSKLGLQHRTQLALYALKAGMV
jgi:NarL family two-component system response regulator LiaR